MLVAQELVQPKTALSCQVTVLQLCTYILHVPQALDYPSATCMFSAISIVTTCARRRSTEA